MKLISILFIVFVFISARNIVAQGNQLSAEFVYGKNELDSFIIDNFVRPLGIKKSDIGFDIWMQFTVDSLSGVSYVKVMDIQPAHKWKGEKIMTVIDSLKPFIKKEATRVIKETAGFWIPKEVNGKYTWEIVEYRMEIRVPEFYSGAEMGYGSYMNRYVAQPDPPADNPVKYYNLGVKKLSQKKHYIAIKYFQKSLVLGNKTKDVYYNLGVAEYLYGLKKDACKSWSKAVELGDTEAQGLIDKNCKN